MKILFMGTPDFAETSLAALLSHGEQVTAAVCQPDRPQGRKMKLTAPPVKQLALEKGLRVYQPETLKNGAIQEVLEKERPELIVVVAYGRLLPKYVLNYPKYGCINLHGSLLPKYRGSAPIQWTVINGEKVGGVSTMYLAEKMDAGDVIDRYETEVGGEETAGELYERLAYAGAKLLCETIDKIRNGTAKAVPQNHAEATFAPMLNKEMGRLDFKKPAIELKNLVRGLNPWPGAFVHTRQGILKVHRASVVNSAGLPIGAIYDRKDALIIQTADGALSLDEVQLQGKKRMSAEEFLRGRQITLI